MTKAPWICGGMAMFGPLIGWLVHNAAGADSFKFLGLTVFCAWSGCWFLASIYSDEKKRAK